jgi:hypothetical protein
VMNSLPASTSRSALIQWILSANRLPLNLVKPSSAGLATVDMATQQPAGKQKALKTAALPVISIGSFAAITDAVWAEDGGLDIALHIPPGIAERLLMQTIANRGRRWG